MATSTPAMEVFIGKVKENPFWLKILAGWGDMFA
jgi:hypothetical protein